MEYPCIAGDTTCGPSITPSANDRDAFTAFIQEFRTQLGTNMLLTIATSAAPAKIDALDLLSLNPLVDSYNVMSYDFTSGSWGDKYTGHQAATFGNPADPLTSR